LLLITPLLVVVVILVTQRPGPDADAPRFVPGAPRSVPSFTKNHYNWIADVAFEGGRIWMWTASATNSHTYLYDLEHRVILGELFNAGVPELCRRDGSRLLCQGRDSPATTLKRRMAEFFRKVLGGKALPAAKRTETFWILDVQSNTAVRVGMLSQLPGAGSRWHPSPNFRYGYTVPSGFSSSFCLCDLESKTFAQFPAPGELQGWWDDQHILVESAPNHLDLFDIVTRKTQTLFTPTSISTFLTQAGLTNEMADLSAFANWNGHDFDFYFGIKGLINGLGKGGSFLLKADRVGPALKLLYRNFDFRWGGVLDNTGTHYLYDGEPGAPGQRGNGGLYLRDLTNHSTFTIVPPDNKGQYAIPRFYGNEVIYFRNRVLHRIRLDGSEDEPLLPVAGFDPEIEGRR